MSTRSKRGADTAVPVESEKTPKRTKPGKDRQVDNSIIDDVKCPVCQETSIDVTTTPCGTDIAFSM
jgi:hypothetical protein